MSALSFLAKRRFNFVDAVYLGLVAGQASHDRWVMAAIIFVIGVPISIAVEAFAARSGQ